MLNYQNQPLLRYSLICQFTSKKVAIAQLCLLRLGLHDDLPMVNKEHAVAGDITLDDGVSLQEDLVLQLEEDGVDEVLVSFLEQRHFPEQPAAHGRHDLLGNK